MKELFEITGRLPLDAFHVRVKTAQQQRTELRVRASCPEAPDLRLFEDVISTHHLVSSVAGQNNLITILPYQFRQKEQWRRSGPNNRLLRVPHHFWKNARDVV